VEAARKKGKFSDLCGTKDAETYVYTEMSLNGEIGYGYCRASKVYTKFPVLSEKYS